MKFTYLLLCIFLLCCSTSKTYKSYVGDKKEKLILNEGYPTELSHYANGNEVLTYWVRKNYRNKKYDEAILHSFFIDNKGNIYNYQASIKRTPFTLQFHN